MLLEDVIAWQRARQQQWRNAPPNGHLIAYRGKQFLVYPDVFWPSEDSLPLVDSLVVRPGDAVLDVGTGSGVIAVFAACKGARRVVAVDVNPAAVKAAKANAESHGFKMIIDVRESDLFDGLEGERFDVITANLPWLDRSAHDVVEAAQWDAGFRTNARFFGGVKRLLKPGGRIYLSQGNYGAVDKVRSLARQHNLDMRLVAEKRCSSNEALRFFAFELAAR